MRILLTGGGTAGSVSPLLSIYSALKAQYPDGDFLFIGTRFGNPEKEMVRGQHITYRSIFSGKFRRYFDFRNISDIFLLLIGFVQSLFIIYSFKPDLIISAGSFVSVPVIWAGWAWQRKILIHQQDIRPSLSNILTMRLATAITVSFKDSLKYFPPKKSIYTGNPARFSADRQSVIIPSDLHDRPILLCIGGGTGSVFINSFVSRNIAELTSRYRVIHIAGQDKIPPVTANQWYRCISFVTDEMGQILKKADMVLSRAGLSTLTELSALGKAAIVIPLPHSHQEDNARYFAERHAIIHMDQDSTTDKQLLQAIHELMSDQGARDKLSKSISVVMKKDSLSGMMKVINGILGYGAPKN